VGGDRGVSKRASEFRPAARAVVIDSARRILLFDYRNTLTGERFLVTPGGAIQPGERDVDAVRREIEEETGTAAPDELAGPIWRRVLSYEWGGRRILQPETFFLWRVDGFEVGAAAMERNREEGIVGQGWFTTGELRDEDRTVAPGALPDLVDRLLAGGPPATPIDLDAAQP
jgi:8-oxo-dGTP pyrophosphatase MutT (NUDIX family)